MIAKKRKLAEYEITQAFKMLEEKNGLGAIAKHFKVTKPTLKKALDMWNSDEKTTKTGFKFRFRRGNMQIIEIPKEGGEDGQKESKPVTEETGKP